VAGGKIYEATNYLDAESRATIGSLTPRGVLARLRLPTFTARMIGLPTLAVLDSRCTVASGASE
jgi:hypothetical protein